MSLYTLNHIKKEYGTKENKVLALNDINCEIERNKLVIILGASGSGKSTLLNVIGGIDRISEGKLMFLEEDISSMSSAELSAFRRDRIGFVFQQYNLINNLTAKENIEFACEISNIDRKIAETMLMRVGLEKRGNHYPSEMSGGEQQRISIARALVKKPPVLLCDEPTGALDVNTGVMVLSLLKEINSTENTSVIIVTHNEKVAELGDVIIRMKDGRIIEKRRNIAKSVEDIEW